MFSLQIKYHTSEDFRKEYPDYFDGGGEIEIPASENRVSLSGQLFKPNMEYEFNITARTEAIRGPPATILVRTRIQGTHWLPVSIKPPDWN